MIAKETQIKVDETIQALCKDIKETVESYSSNGTRAMELRMLPELINSVANLVRVYAWRYND